MSVEAYVRTKRIGESVKHYSGGPFGWSFDLGEGRRQQASQSCQHVSIMIDARRYRLP